MKDDETLRFEAELNAAIEEAAYRFGPVNVRRTEAFLPERESTWTVTDTNGRRAALHCGIETERAVTALHNRHKHRIPLDHETKMVQRTMDDAFEGLTRGRIDVAVLDALDGRRDSFLCFQVDLDLLSPSLAWRRHRIDWRPYSSAGDQLVRLLVHQRRRLKMLGSMDAPRRDALLCCPVLARRMRAADNPCSWHDLLATALADMSTRDMPHFRDGRLVDVVEIKRSVRWIDGKLTVYEQLPDTVVASLPGRGLTDVVRHPHLPDGIRITGAKRKGKSVVISTDAATVPFEGVLDDIHARAHAQSPRTVRRLH